MSNLNMNENLEASVAKLEQCFDKLVLLVDELANFTLEVSKRTNEHIGRIYQEIHEIAPEKEIIDTVYLDNEQERREAIERYMNHADIDTVYAD